MTTGLPLFDLPRTEQRENLARVSRRITALVTQFVNERIGQQFTADELRRFVAEQEPTAPGSADRILRDLRQRGVINYRVVSRSRSEYEALAVEARQ